MKEGWILVIFYFLLVLVNGQDGIEVPNWTEAHNMVSATVPYCPEQPQCTPALVTETLPYIMDCRKYIYCNTDGTEMLLTCSFNLHYRASDGECVDPSVAECPKCGSTIETTTQSTTTTRNSTGSTIPVCPEQPICMPEDAYKTLPYIDDCTKYIYCSPDGSEILIACINSTHYSPTQEICMEPELAGCPQCGTTTQGSTSVTIPVCPVQPLCMPEDAYKTLPYIDDCTKYIYCPPDGTEILITCVNSTHYSPTQEICMEPELAGCPKCGTTIESTTETTTPSTIGSTTPVCPVQAICMPEDTYKTLPYIADCTKYIYCAPGSEVLVSCPNSTHYSPTQDICMEPELAGCPKCGTTIESTTVTTTQSSTGPTIPVCPVQQTCMSEDTYKTLPYIADCTKYIYCAPGSEVLVSCPNSTHYSPTQDICMEPELAGCPKCGTTIESTTVTTTQSSTTELTATTQSATVPTTPVCPVQQTCLPENIYGTLPYIADCTKYIYCSPDGSEVLVTCPNGTHYSPTQNVCMEPALAGCPKCPGLMAPTIDPQCVQEYCMIEVPFVSLPYVADCTQYIYCHADGSEELRMCETGEHFNPVKRYCTDKATAQCPDCTGQGKKSLVGIHDYLLK